MLRRYVFFRILNLTWLAFIKLSDHEFVRWNRPILSPVWFLKTMETGRYDHNDRNITPLRKKFPKLKKIYLISYIRNIIWSIYAPEIPGALSHGTEIPEVAYLFGNYRNSASFTAGIFRKIKPEFFMYWKRLTGSRSCRPRSLMQFIIL